MSFILEGLDHVQLAAPVGGENLAREFYQEILGFTEVEKPVKLQKRGGVWFQAGEIAIHIGVEEPFIPAEKAHPAISVQGMENLQRYLLSKNIKITEDANIPGANRFYVKDPFGNRIEFIEWQ